jgi:Ca2+-binding EF-hand superfamily protein/subtilisin-like proprotein convertase family protein
MSYLKFNSALICLLCGLVTVLVTPLQVWGQAGLREALERLDRDSDGEIEPHEITPQARPYLERIAQTKRLSLDRDIDIEDLQEAARIYHAMQTGVGGAQISVTPSGTVRPFELEQSQVLIPEFGLADVKYPYTAEDVEDGARSLRRSDANGDGFIDRSEASNGQWRDIDPFEFDADKDGRLSRMELIQRHARRRLMSEDSQELIQKVRRVGIGIRPVPPRQRDDNEDQWWRRGGSSNWLTGSLLSRFDTNRNGRLEGSELKKLGFPAARIDLNRDGELSRDELHAYLTEIQAEAGDESQGLPGWFYELDADRDGQVSMTEFSQDWTEAKRQEFALLDTNADGLLTASEVANSKALMGGSYSNEAAEPLPPHKTIISEIEIAEDVLIGDLDVRLSITHTHTAFLDGFLTSPSGERVELFSEVGGSGDHFDETIFDDQAGTPINKAQPPFRGSFTTTAQVKRQPSLAQFNGQNARGIWQLVIRGTHNDRFGVLHGWALIIRPKEAMLDAAPVAVDVPVPDSSSQ